MNKRTRKKVTARFRAGYKYPSRTLDAAGIDRVYEWSFAIRGQIAMAALNIDPGVFGTLNGDST